MKFSKFFDVFKAYVSIISVYLLSTVGIVFSVLYFSTFDIEFVNNYYKITVVACITVITFLSIISIIFLKSDKSFIYKLSFLVILIIAVVLGVLYALKVSGFYNKIKSIEDFRNYIASFGNFAVILFILIQFLQVAVLPIPAFITVGAGVLLFGPFLGAVFSCIGIILGSLFAYFIGRIFGYKVVKWLVGKDALDKGLKTIKGKDKIILTFMFLFPFFPDDVLCFVAGITTITPLFFVIMIVITRIISVFASSYSFNGDIIPYNTWWGILLWILFFIVTVLLAIFIYKKGEKIEKYFAKKTRKN